MFRQEQRQDQWQQRRVQASDVRMQAQSTERSGHLVIEAEDVHFSYDALGRLAGQHLATGEEPITYVYSKAGTTSVSDALDNVTTTWLDRRGRDSAPR